MNLSEYDQSFYNESISTLAGVDEAGRGPLAGPVVAAAVIFPYEFHLDDIQDSKKISEKKRLLVYEKIITNALDYGIGVCHEGEIDDINILESTYIAMKKALGCLRDKPDLTLIDGKKTKIKIYNCKHIIKGDSKSQSIAAASIIAKVTRDKMMINYDKIFPDYGFAKHKGYGTKFHLEAIKNKKSTPIHRKSFNPVSLYLPSFSYFNTDIKMNRLAVQLTASSYVKNEYDIIEIYSLEKFDIFHYEKDRYVLSIVKFAFKNDESNDFNIDKLKDELILKEKELKQDIELDVILVVFSKQKPKIVIKKNVSK